MIYFLNLPQHFTVFGLSIPMFGFILVVLMILYLKDYGAAKKLQQYK